jgi:hypothetical protein
MTADMVRSRKELPIRKHWRYLKANSLGWNHVNELVYLHAAPRFDQRLAGFRWCLHVKINQGG